MPPEPTTCPECECPGYDLCHVGTQSPAADRVAALDADSRSLLRDLEALEAENRWIPVTEMMPPGGWTPRVLFAWRNTHGKRVSAGSWIKARTVEASGDLLEEDCDYDEDSDTYYVAEGWREWGWEEAYSAAPDGEVTHWRVIPRHPEEGGPDAP